MRREMKLLVKQSRSAAALSRSEAKEFPRGKFPTLQKVMVGLPPKKDSAEDCVRF